MKFIGYNVFDLHKLKGSKYSYNEIDFHIKDIMKYGVLNYLFKNILWKLDINGIARIFFDNKNDFLFSTSEINKWQIVKSLKTTILSDVDIINIGENMIEFKKKKESYLFKSVSFGVVFSGNKNELDQLKNSIDSIIKSCEFSGLDVEIVICGPSSFSEDELLKNYKFRDKEIIRYEPFDDVYNSENCFSISRKKNFLISKLRHDIVVLSHTRIVFDSSFLKEMESSKFDIASPSVFDSQGNKYLGFVLIGSYDTSKLNPRKAITGMMLCKDYYRLMRNRVAYSDGGIILLNKNKVESPIFNQNLHWGQAEDLDLSGRNYYNGILTDFIPNLKCYSVTNKVKISKFKNNRLANSIRNKLISIGVY